MSNKNINNVLLPGLQATADRLVKQFNTIPTERRELLALLTGFVQEKLNAKEVVNLNFICTHNSRRSHISQLWAQAAAHYYSVPNVKSYSGGTEATAFNPRAVRAMRDAGFAITEVKPGQNPAYDVLVAEGVTPVVAFSKAYNDPFNPDKNFAAIMTCSDADENCPLVIGASARIALTYHDPKAFDDTAQEAEKYRERVEQIGTEILFAFSNVRVTE